MSNVRKQRGATITPKKLRIAAAAYEPIWKLKWIYALLLKRITRLDFVVAVVAVIDAAAAAATAATISTATVAIAYIAGP